MKLNLSLIAQRSQCFTNLAEKAINNETILKDKKHIQAMEQSLEYLIKVVKQIKQNS